MKKYKIILGTKIFSKLENILDYIANDSPKVAIDIIDGIQSQINSLTTMPERFPVVPENISYKNHIKIRHCFYKKSFRIIYLIHQDKVRILDIRHSMQDKINYGDIA